MIHEHAIGILAVAARVERSNRINAASKGERAECARLDAILSDYETAIEILQTTPARPEKGKPECQPSTCSTSQLLN